MKYLNKIKSIIKGSGSERKVTLGKVIGKPWLREELSEGELNHHVHIVGASGFGKSVMLSHIAQQQINQGKGFLYIDLKGDIETLLKFQSYAENAGRKEDLKIFSLTDQELSSSYNLISIGTPTQLRDKILLSLNWSEEYYKNQSSSILLKILIILCWLRDNQNFTLHIGHILDSLSDCGKFVSLADKVPDTEVKVKNLALEIQKFLKNPEYFSSLQGLRTQLESVVLADFGKLIMPSDKGIDLFKVVETGKIVLVFLDSRRYGETSKVMGKFFVQDLKMVSAKIDSEVRKQDRIPFTVIVDEFADLAQDDFISFLDRARSSKMSIVVAHQEIADLLKVSPTFARRLMGNTSTLYAFLQKSPDSAEMLAKIAGTKTVKKETVQMGTTFFIPHPTGTKSVSEQEEFIVHPNVIKSLRVGQCVCIKKYPTAKSSIVRINYEEGK